MEISFTRLRIFLECPWKYKLLFRNGERIPPSPAASLGLSLHRALEEYHRGGPEELDRLLALFWRHWLDEGFQDPAQREEWREKGRKILGRHFEAERSRRARIAGVEKEFIYELGGHKVRGMIDRIDMHPDGRCELIDYKTGASQPGAIAGDLQMRFYALGAREGLGLEPGILTFRYLSSGDVASIPYDRAGEEGLKDEIRRASDAIEAGEFKTDASFCPGCGLKATCAFSVDP